MNPVPTRAALRQEIRRIISDQRVVMEQQGTCHAEYRQRVQARVEALMNPANLLGIMRPGANALREFVYFLLEQEERKRPRDFHSERAVREGIPRDEAKRRNFAFLYGGGDPMPGYTAFLKKFVHDGMYKVDNAIIQQENFDRLRMSTTVGPGGPVVACSDPEFKRQQNEQHIQEILRMTERMLRSGTATVKIDQPIQEGGVDRFGEMIYIPGIRKTMTISGTVPPRYETEPPQHPNCRCTAVPVPKEKKMRRKKFYVARPDNTMHMTDSAVGFDKLSEATDAAKLQVEQTGEEAVILKLVAVARRKIQPIVVESVK